MELFALPLANINTLHYSTATIINTPSDIMYRPMTTTDIWNVASTRPMDSNKLALKPVDFMSEKSYIKPNTEIDSTSFIVLKNNEDVFDNRSESIQSNNNHVKPNDEIFNSSQRCNDCCFCDPDLHKRSRTMSPNCSYCNRLNSKWKASCSTSQDTNLNIRSNTRPNQTYETLSKSNQSNSQTRFKDSDISRLKCTRNNSLDRRNQPEEDTYSAKTNKPPKVPNISPKRVKSPSVNSIKQTSKSAIEKVRLPSPFIKNANSTSAPSYDSASSSSSSQCASSISCGPQSPHKKCPALPAARWQIFNSVSTPKIREGKFTASGVKKKRTARFQELNDNFKSNLIERTGLNEAENRAVSENQIQSSEKQHNSGKSYLVNIVYKYNLINVIFIYS